MQRPLQAFSDPALWGCPFFQSSNEARHRAVGNISQQTRRRSGAHSPRQSVGMHLQLFVTR
jgi:hypothetical protein